MTPPGNPLLLVSKTALTGASPSPHPGDDKPEEAVYWQRDTAAPVVLNAG